ncbi:MAG TPA: DUF3035 domain-containing protein [Rhodospirillaceae bacterium]|nr:MAG: hypothetical protein A2018_01630 [Alphaproteobacteria bacterium GWF2_58_20]HAU28544.1 DUF3035 domain-containing protein [Rhodospirillaceae bacterium]
MTSFPRILSLIALTVLVAGCSNARQTLGLGRQSPDEFSVVRQAPLSMPPAWGLTAPQPGLSRPQDIEPTKSARNLVMGETPAPAGSSSGERAFLSLAGANQADDNIRALVDRETTGLVLADKNAIDKLIFWQQQDPPDPIVDAKKEALRLKENAESGTPVTHGETPVIERRRKALFEGVFK